MKNSITGQQSWFSRVYSLSARNLVQIYFVSVFFWFGTLIWLLSATNTSELPGLLCVGQWACMYGKWVKNNYGHVENMHTHWQRSVVHAFSFWWQGGRFGEPKKEKLVNKRIQNRMENNAMGQQDSVWPIQPLFARNIVQIHFGIVFVWYFGNIWLCMTCCQRPAPHSFRVLCVWVSGHAW